MCSPEPQNKTEYGAEYHNEKRMANMKVGYVHPYHSEGSPIYLSGTYYMQSVFAAVGPEQVSPHYESLSRSRRGLIFSGLYISSIMTISRLGGWDHNSWLRAMLFHHEFLLALYLSNAEMRHFTFVLGPKFSIFYNSYSRYEYKQLMLMWADSAELLQNTHLR